MKLKNFSIAFEIANNLGFNTLRAYLGILTYYIFTIVNALLEGIGLIIVVDLFTGAAINDNYNSSIVAIIKDYLSFFDINDVPFNNIATHKNPKPITAVIFEDFSGNEVSLKDYYGKLLIINFWATWCAPCKEEMPSLDLLQSNEKLNNLKIIPINVGKDKIQQASIFFEDLEIKNLDLYFDSPKALAVKFKLRGIPTTIIFNKKGEELARIIGSIDFEDEKFLKWLSTYN